VRALTASEVVSIWERTRGQKLLRQALEWLAYAAPERSREEWAAQPVGQVCQALFHLRSMMFGPEMPGLAACPRCGERVEFVFQCLENVPRLELAAPAGGRLTVENGGRRMQIRLPAVADLLAVRSAEELLALCAEGSVDDDPRWIEAASAQVAEADPLAETMLDLTCPVCEHRWQALLDIAAYLSREIAHQARRLLSEVHRLAMAYGWREPEILALGPARRRAYLDMVGA
jgi:hypothetical protein